jgi:hypothetical protein
VGGSLDRLAAVRQLACQHRRDHNIGHGDGKLIDRQLLLGCHHGQDALKPAALEAA